MPAELLAIHPLDQLSIQQLPRLVVLNLRCSLHEQRQRTVASEVVSWVGDRVAVCYLPLGALVGLEFAVVLLALRRALLDEALDGDLGATVDHSALPLNFYDAQIPLRLDLDWFELF